MDFIKEVEKLNISLDDRKLDQFEKYYNRLVEVNSYMNLTAITEHDEVYNKHFLDSLSFVKALDLKDGINLCDVGSGAGFPSIPLAIAYPYINITIIDALNKRIKFLNELTSYIELNNANAYHKRAEEYAKEKREFFDIVTARAVARLNVLAELCLPLTKINGYFVAMKGQSGDEELDEAKRAIELLGAKFEREVEFELPDDAGKRIILVFKKIKPTPGKYPRAFAKIKEKPL